MESFLAFIAVSDMISLLTLMIPDYFEQMDVDVTTSFICSVTIYIYHAANKISDYILIAAYLFKLHGLYKPMTLISKNHSRQSVIICLAIFMVFFVIDSYMVILEMHPPLPLTNIVLNREVVELYACRLSETAAAFPTIYFLVYTFVYVIVPGLALIVLSVAIMVVLRRSYKQHMLLVKADVAKPSSSANNVFTSAWVTATILVLTIPRTIILLIYYITRPQKCNFNLLRLYIMNARCVAPINFCINFYVQIVCSKYFRQAILPCTKSAKS